MLIIDHKRALWFLVLWKSFPWFQSAAYIDVNQDVRSLSECVRVESVIVCLCAWVNECLCFVSVCENETFLKIYTMILFDLIRVVALLGYRDDSNRLGSFCSDDREAFSLRASTVETVVRNDESIRYTRAERCWILVQNALFVHWV